MKIIKNSGEIVDFNTEKLRKSLTRSGASRIEVENILGTVAGHIYQGIKTKQIYRLAFKLLKKISASHAARYNLRAAIQQLGPAGFFFEKFIALVFEAEGYQAKTNLILKGKCVSHEVDIVIRKNNSRTMVECKFHANSAAVSDVKVPMYILSRYNDLRENEHELFSGPEKLDGCKIVTNNRFTSDAVTFARCSGQELLSWDFPPNDSLKSKIDGQKLYPVTCLTTLSAVEKEKLLILGVVLVSQLIDRPECLSDIDLSENRRKIIFNEAAGLCNIL